jgi:hypothetical protein
MHGISRFGLVGMLFAVWTPASAIEACAPELGPRGAYLLTFGPGDSVHSAFGHTALLLYDPRQGERSSVYDFGHFDMTDTAALVWGMAIADQQYWIEQHPLGPTLQTYARGGRGLVAQQLALSDTETRALYDALEGTLANTPSFHYNWYDPNCTTRVRDLLDEILGGTLRPQHQEPSGNSRARQVLRHTANVPWFWFALRWGSGREAEQELTHWASAFLPVTLMERVGASTHDGHPLVASTCRMLPDWTEPIPEQDPNRDGVLAAIGLGVAGGLVAADRFRRPLALRLVGWLGVAVGLFGSAALWAWAMDTFAPAWGSHNLVFANPLHLGLVAGAILAPRRPESRVPLGLALAPLVVAGLGFLGALASGFADRNLGIAVMFVLPLSAAAWVLRPRRVSRVEGAP